MATGTQSPTLNLAAVIEMAARQLESRVDPLQVSQQLRGALAVLARQNTSPRKSDN